MHRAFFLAALFLGIALEGLTAFAAGHPHPSSTHPSTLLADR